MINFKFLLISVIAIFSICLHSCEDCDVDPDLIIDLAAPTSDIIKGESVDWDYIVESTKENSKDCNILAAIASIGAIIIDFFVDPNDNSGEQLYNQGYNIGALDAGEFQKVTNQIDVFNNNGIYLLEAKADTSDVVTEREENNNTDDAMVDVRSSSISDDIFHNASPEFKEKLEKSSAIIIVGQVLVGHAKPDSYKGKPIYYAK